MAQLGYNNIVVVIALMEEILRQLIEPDFFHQQYCLMLQKFGEYQLMWTISHTRMSQEVSERLASRL